MKASHSLQPQPDGGDATTQRDSQQQFQTLAVLRALADPTRLGLILCLVEGERCVGDLTDTLGLRQPRISHHLAILRQLDLVVNRRAGKKVYYRLHPSWRLQASSSLLDLGPLQLRLRAGA